MHRIHYYRYPTSKRFLEQWRCCSLLTAARVANLALGIQRRVFRDEWRIRYYALCSVQCVQCVHVLKDNEMMRQAERLKFIRIILYNAASMVVWFGVRCWVWATWTMIPDVWHCVCWCVCLFALANSMSMKCTRTRQSILFILAVRMIVHLQTDVQCDVTKWQEWAMIADKHSSNMREWWWDWRVCLNDWTVVDDAAQWSTHANRNPICYEFRWWMCGRGRNLICGQFFWSFNWQRWECWIFRST